MSDSTYWTGSWNCIPGCDKSSPGCLNCWALAMIKRGAAQDTEYGQACRDVLTEDRSEWNGKAVFLENPLDKPTRWKKPRTIAVNWLGDMFRWAVPDLWCDRVVNICMQAPRHQYLLLTKQVSNMLAYATRDCFFVKRTRSERESGAKVQWPDNIWWGLTACNQCEINVLVPDLLLIPGRRWLSLEPLLGPVDLIRLFGGTSLEPGPALHALNAAFDWIVVGAETGPGARECKAEWVQSIVDQCRSAGVPVWVKQAPPPAITPEAIALMETTGSFWPRQKPEGMP